MWDYISDVGYNYFGVIKNNFNLNKTASRIREMGFKIKLFPVKNIRGKTCR